MVFNLRITKISCLLMDIARTERLAREGSVMSYEVMWTRGKCPLRDGGMRG